MPFIPRVQPGTAAALRNAPGTPLGGGSRWGRRTSTIPGAFGVNRAAINELDYAIETMRGIPNEFERGMDVMVQLLAAMHQGIAQQKSRGVVTPTGQLGQPWTIPVRRIGLDYYQGWRRRRVRRGIWEVFNAAREAFFIEHGINPRALGAAIPRPIMKISALDVLRFIQRTRVAERFTEDILGPLRDKRGRYRSFQSRSRAFQLLMAGRSVAGPQARLP
jgi:hypothetical protein